jgi:O-antigen/teichoic acid export membrane protein
MDKDIARTLEDMSSISLIKLSFILILSGVLALFLYIIYADIDVFFAVGISFIVLGGQAFISPFLIYYGAKFNQKLITKISSFKNILRFICLAGLFIYKDIFYYFVIEVIINLFYSLFWVFLVRRYQKISFKNILLFRKTDWRYIKTIVIQYSLWTHLTGVVTNFVYKSDTLFLSFFEGLTVIGNYNIALNTSNMANVIPSILGYQNSIALSNTQSPQKIENITNVFLNISFYLGILSIMGFVCFGHFFLQLMTGHTEVTEIYLYLLFIVISLIIIKTFSSPLVALINIKGDVRIFFKNVSVPLFIVSIFSYLGSAYLYGAYGVAAANVFNAMVWLFLIIKESSRLKYTIKLSIRPFEDYQNIKKFFKNA